jgi:hypothetical protein
MMYLAGKRPADDKVLGGNSPGEVKTRMASIRFDLRELAAGATEYD